MAQLTLCPNGKLLYVAYDAEEVAPGIKSSSDVTSNAIEYLMEEVELHHELRLVDVFSLLRRNELLQLIFARDWSREYVEKAFELEIAELGQRRTDSDVDFLELYSMWERDTKTNQLESGYHRLSFHGVGPILSVDLVEQGHCIGRAGDRIQYSISFTPLKELLGLPLRYKKEIDIIEGCPDDHNQYNEKLDNIIVEHPTLMQVIHGVFWELSFHGSPNDTAEVGEDLFSKVDAIKKSLGDSHNEF